MIRTRGDMQQCSEGGVISALQFRGKYLNRQNAVEIEYQLLKHFLDVLIVIILMGL